MIAERMKLNIFSSSTYEDINLREKNMLIDELLEFFVKGTLGPFVHEQSEKIGKKEPQPDGHTMEQNGNEDLAITIQNGVDHAACHVVRIESVTVVVVVLVVGISFTRECIYRHVRVYVARLNVDHVDVAVCVQFGA